MQKVVKLFKKIKNKFKTNIETEYYCPVCKTQVVSFERLPDNFMKNYEKFGFIHSIFLFETLNLFQYSCPLCNASDRERLYAMFINKMIGAMKGPIAMLDIAPSKPLTDFLRRIPDIKLRTADLLMDNVDDKVNITDMNIYKDCQYDVFICSHVLEHVEDDIKALRELYRILNKGGWGIIMAPINLGLDEIYENSEIINASDRWKHFGQDDHLRIYSKQGFIKRIKSVGFKINQYGINFFGREEYQKNGINERSVLYIVTK